MLLFGQEIYIYANIGNVHSTRLQQIEEYKRNGQDGTLNLKEMPSKICYYHMDCNLPNEEWFTYRHFLLYYGLNEKTKIEFK